MLGGVAGAVIGNNSGSLHHNAWQGAAIGTVAGALLGSAVGESRERAVYRGTQVPTPSGYYSYGPAYNSYGYSGYSEPYYAGSRYSRPSYASSGLLLGGLAGGIIGNNSRSHNTWGGAAIGAGAGLLLGALADQGARENEARDAVIQDAQNAAAVQSAAQNTPQNVTIINNYYGGSTGTPMSSANSMFGR